MSCFYQSFSPIRRIVDGWGDCSVCKSDDSNRNCRGFIGVTVYEFSVEGNNDQKTAETITQTPETKVNAEKDV